jgi:hypothetical protein
VPIHSISMPLRSEFGEVLWGFLSLTLPIFHEDFLLPSGLSPENEEISAPPPFGLLIEVYIFYENWSTETFRKKVKGVDWLRRTEDGFVWLLFAGRITVEYAAWI